MLNNYHSNATFVCFSLLAVETPSNWLIMFLLAMLLFLGANTPEGCF